MRAPRSDWRNANWRYSREKRAGQAWAYLKEKTHVTRHIGGINSIFILFAAIGLLTGLGYAEEANLARDSMVSCNNGRAPEFAVDGEKDGEYWEAGLIPSLSWLEVDLGEIKDISKIHLYMWWGGDNRYYQYYIEVSADRKTWKEVVNERKNTLPSSAEGRIYAFAPTNARFVRLTVTHNTANPCAHVREIEVYGK